MHRAIARLLIVPMVLVATVGCRSMTGQSLGTNIDNKTTTATVKTKLAADKLQNLTWVDVDTNDGTVYLSGMAATAEQRARAEDIAQSVEGVKRVVNNIQVSSRAASSGQTSPGTMGAQSGHQQSVSASPAVGLAGRHMMTGEVTSIDHNTGQVSLRTSEADLRLHFPPPAIANVKEGDRMTVELGIRR
jgi:hyperosmotically inducible periplasmic protein